jgi:hypothetical protein
LNGNITADELSPAHGSSPADGNSQSNENNCGEAAAA